MIPLISPVPYLFYITTHFSERYLFGIHQGLDLRTKNNQWPSGVGMPIIAAATGSYIFHGYSRRWGNHIILLHNCQDGQYRTIYAHLSQVNHRPGWTIRNQGDVVGLSGKSGSFLTGPHLHFEVQIWNTRSSRWQPIDPLLGLITFKLPKI